MRRDRRNRRNQWTSHERKTRGSGRRRARIGTLLATLLAVAALAGASPAVANEHDPNTAGHPLRIVAYLLHPVGVAIDYLLLRPAHWLVEHEPFKTAFGHED